MDEHTPGPWYCTATSHHYYDYRITSKNGLLSFDVAQNYANAKVIAAAPDMLAVLEHVVEQYTELPVEVLAEVAPYWLMDALKAIDKARGIL